MILVSQVPDTGPANKPLLGAATDFTFLGSYVTAGNSFEGGNVGQGRGLTHRYVASVLHFLTMGYDGSTLNNPVYEFTLPAGGYGGTITNTQVVNTWPDIFPTISAPSAPVVNTSSSGGTIVDGTYQVKISYSTGGTFDRALTGPGGETDASGSTTIVTSGGNLSTITITSPGAASNYSNAATGYNVYVTQAGGSTYYLQNTSAPIAIGTNYTLTAPPVSGGYQPIAHNTSGGPPGASGVGGGNEWGIYWDTAKNGLWVSQSFDYPQGLGSVGSDSGLQISSCVSFRQLGVAPAISNYVGKYGLHGVGARAISSGVRAVPSAWQSRFGIPYAYFAGWGGYTSQMAQGLGASLGLVVCGIPDLTTYTSPTAAIPTTDFTIYADHRSGVTHASFGAGGTVGDWYSAYTGPGYVPPFDRGNRNASVSNFYDGGIGHVNGSGNLTLTNGSTAVTFSVAVTLSANWYVQLNTDSPGVQLASAVTAATTGTLVSSYTNTGGTGAWTYSPQPIVNSSIEPTGPPLPEGTVLADASVVSWQNAAPDGNTKWVWGDTFDGALVLIEGATKHGIVAIGSFQKGNAWYGGAHLNCDNQTAELQIFDPADFAKVASGTLKSWNVQPKSSRILDGDLSGTYPTLFNGVAGACKLVCGATFDSTTNILWLWFFAGSGKNVLAAYQVNS